MIAKIAVSAATFAIDKPYSYHVPEDLALEPGMRVTVPFGRGNRRSEGVVLTIEDGEDRSLKAVERSLDEEPVLSPYGLRLAAFLRERYFCTFYDAIRAMLPGGLWFKEQASVALTEDDSWKDAVIKKEGAFEILTHLEALGGNWISIAYAGVLSMGAAYGMQIIGQRDVEPATASLIMSLEAVFAVLCGVIFLHETMTKWEILGCVLLFVAVVLPQIPLPKKSPK